MKKDIEKTYWMHHYEHFKTAQKKQKKCSIIICHNIIKDQGVMSNVI